jgi:lipopolysaccharide transport system permease protein
VKYKQAILGFAWAILVPVMNVALFTIIGRAAGWQNSVQAPYPVFVYAGLLPWLFFQASINNGGMSLVSQQALISKIYLPRLFMPLATLGSALVDMSLSFLVFAGLMAVYRYTPSWQIVFLPLLLLLALIVGMGFAFLLSALTVIWRDVRFLIPFFAQILMWLSGAVYPPRIFKNHEKWLAIDPVYGVITGFRSAILGEAWHPAALTIAAIEGLALLLFGLLYFKKAERRFADIA